MTGVMAYFIGPRLINIIADGADAGLLAT